MKNIIAQTKVNLIGESFNKLTVTGISNSIKTRRTVYTCLCDCGNESFVERAALILGRIKSCGCSKHEAQKHRRGKQFEYLKIARNEYWIWQEMHRRCNNPKNASFKNYGGRGITVCPRWSEFLNFLEDMGCRPNPLLTLDRINNDGNYDPDNCQWATRKEQQANRRCSAKYNKNSKQE